MFSNYKGLQVTIPMAIMAVLDLAGEICLKCTQFCMYQKLCRLRRNQKACFSRHTSQRVNMHVVIPKCDSSDGIKLMSGAHVSKMLPGRRESYCTGSQLHGQIIHYNTAWSSRATSQQRAWNLNLKHTHLPQNVWTAEDFLNPVQVL